jgi:hypothetical protein
MTQPTSYQISTDFSQEESNQVSGRSTVRTAALDAEFSNIATTLAEALANLALIQRDDTALKDSVVEIHTLSSEVLALIASGSWDIRGAWITATAYYVGDIVTNGGLLYLGMEDHTSGTFATDLAAIRWAQLTANPSASGVTFTPTSTLDSVTVQAAIEELDGDLRPTVNTLKHQLFNGV